MTSLPGLDDLLDLSKHYSEERITIRSLEETIHTERTLQNTHVDRLSALRTRNQELQVALSEEVHKLRDLSEQLHSQRNQSGFQKFVSKLPFLGKKSTPTRSMEEILRRQYELSALRVKEAAEFSDRLDAAKEDLYDEIERLNQRIIDYSRNEKVAAQHVLRLSDLKMQCEAQLATAELHSLEAREAQSRLDRVKRALAEHSAMLKLFSTAETRLAKLQENTRMLAQTIAQLQSDIAVYVAVASEKLDLIAGQIQAIGAAADASVVMLELRQSLEAMTESVNHTTRFVSETQAYFRANVDQMVSNLDLYDSETERVLQNNLAMNQVYDDMQIADAMAIALEQRIELEFSHPDAQQLEHQLSKASQHKA